MHEICFRKQSLVVLSGGSMGIQKKQDWPLVHTCSWKIGVW